MDNNKEETINTCIHGDVLIEQFKMSLTRDLCFISYKEGSRSYAAGFGYKTSAHKWIMSILSWYPCKENLTRLRDTVIRVSGPSHIWPNRQELPLFHHMDALTGEVSKCERIVFPMSHIVRGFKQ